MHERVYQAFQDEVDVVIPKLYSQWTTQHMMVTEFRDGLHPLVYLQNASEKDRNNFARQLYRFMNMARLKHGWLYTDPHFGNFLVNGRQLIVLDFGGMVAMPDEDIRFARKYVRALAEGDGLSLYSLLQERKSFEPTATRYEEYFHILAPVLMRPFHHDCIRPYIFPGELSLREWLVKHRKSVNLLPTSRDYFHLQIDSLLEDIFRSMGAEINWHRELLGVLDDIEMSQWRWSGGF